MKIRPEINQRVLLHGRDKGTVYAHYVDKKEAVGVHLDPSERVTSFDASWIKGVNISVLEPLRNNPIDRHS